MNSHFKSKGFTLIELLIAITLFAILVAGFYSVFWVGIRAHINEERTTRSYQNVRLVLNKIALDFQNALYTSNLGLGGKATEIYFFTSTEITSEPIKVQYRTKKESQSLALIREVYGWKDSLGEKEKIKPIRIQEMAFPLKGIQFEYYRETEESESDISLFAPSTFSKKEKTFEWVPTWKVNKGFPLGIKVKISYEDHTFSRFIPSSLHHTTKEETEIETVQQEENSR